MYVEIAEEIEGEKKDYDSEWEVEKVLGKRYGDNVSSKT
jgi:hypothetical protein